MEVTVKVNGALLKYLLGLDKLSAYVAYIIDITDWKLVAT